MIISATRWPLAGHTLLSALMVKTQVMTILEQRIFLNLMQMEHGVKLKCSKQVMLDIMIFSATRWPLAGHTLLSVLIKKTTHLLLILEQRIFFNVVQMEHGVKLKCSKQVMLHLVTISAPRWPLAAITLLSVLIMKTQFNIIREQRIFLNVMEHHGLKLKDSK